MSERLRLITSLRSTIEATLRPLLADQRAVALLDFPNHSNVGDSAIWLGELACLRTLGVRRLRYCCDLLTYDREQLARRIGRGTILLHGGGNLGDLWRSHQRFREEVIASFPDNRIIQLPQTVHFQDRSALTRARAVLNGHPNLTLLLRERRSFEIAEHEFRGRHLLCPDMAFCLGPLPQPVPAARPLLWLLRTDREAGLAVPPSAPPNSRVDWLGEPPTVLAAINRWLSRRGRLGRALRGAVSATFEPLARQRLARGCRLLSAAGTVVTDRLHGHILCLLLGIPHVLLENSYGKLAAFYETWTSQCSLVRWGRTPSEALALTTDRSAGPDGGTRGVPCA